MESVQDKIRRKRREFELTQDDLANFCDVSRRTITRWEKDGIETARVRDVRRLAAVLQCSVAWLMGGAL